MYIKNKIKTSIYLFLIVTNWSCQEKKDMHSFTIENTNKMKNNIIEKVLTKQLQEGSTLTIDDAGAGLPKIKFGFEELEATSLLADKVLESNGFKTLMNEDFNQKIKNIFGRIIDVNSESNFLYINFFDNCDREFIMYKNNEIDYAGTFIDKQRKIITDFYYLPEIIDYKKDYPKLDNVENDKIFRKSSIDDLDIEIPNWRDIPNLKEIRKKNLQTIVARNMYLFNDNRAQFKWLILNDQFFMSNLVKTFGYTKDIELLQWVIEKTNFDKNNPQIYGELFWIEQCDGTVRIHSNTFKVLQKLYLPNDSSENRFIPENIKNYIQYFGGNTQQDSKNISQTDKIKILANLAYFVEQYKYDQRYNDSSKIMGMLRYLLTPEDFDILEKNNYFNLPKFKEWWNNADYDEYIIDGETNGEWGSTYHPLSESEWRKQNPKK